MLLAHTLNPTSSLIESGICGFQTPSVGSSPLINVPSFHYENSTRDFFLVPVAQARGFLNHVHDETGLEKSLLNVPVKQLNFYIDPNAIHSPPSLIGKVSSSAEYDAMVKKYGWNFGDRTVKKKMEKEKKAKKRKEKQLLSMMSWTASIRCARQHLGIGNKACPAKEVSGDAVPLDREKPVFVAIDVEAWEMDHNRITEIGIATLDTANIPSVDKLPALSMADIDLDTFKCEDGVRITRATVISDLIKCRHLRISEHKSMRNGTYVSDAADKFDFGESEWVSLADVPAILGASMRFYDEDGNKRKIILVGHDIKQDMAFLRVAGYDVWNIKDLEVMDTTSMHKAVCDIHESRGLSKVLMDMGVIFWDLHNAGNSNLAGPTDRRADGIVGNDAAYTLQALVHLADRGVASRSQSIPEDEEGSPPQAPMVLEDGEYPDYEDLVEAGCISYLDAEKTQLGPRPPRDKKGKGRRKSKARANEEPLGGRGSQNNAVVSNEGW